MKNQSLFFRIIKKIAWIFIQLFGSLISLGVGAVFFLLVFLSLRPLPLNFLLPYLTPHLSAFSVQIACKNVSLVWREWAHPFELQIDDLSVHLNSQQIHIPHVALHLSLFNALQGKIVISKATLLETCFPVGGEETGSTSAAPTLLLEHIPQIFDPSFLEGLKYLTLKETSFKVPFCTKPLTWPSLTLRFRRKKDILWIDAISQNKSFLKGGIHLNAPENKVTLSFKLTDFKLPPDFCLPSSSQKVLSFLEALPPLSGSLEGVYDLAQKKWIKGEIQLSQADKKEHSFPGIGRPLKIKDFKAMLTLQNRKIILENLSFKVDNLPLTIQGNFNEDSREFFVKVYAPNPISLDLLSVLWPEKLALNPREWIFENLADGHIKNVIASSKGTWDLEAFPLITQLSGDMLLEGLTVTYLEGMPVVKQACGKAVFDQDQFFITFTKGVLEKQSLQKGTLLIDGLQNDWENLKTDLYFQGPLQNILQIIDNPPLEYTKGLGLLPNTFKGSARTNLKLDFPLKKNLTLKEIKIDVISELTDVSFSHQIGKTKTPLSMTKGNLKLKVTSKDLNIEGFGEVNKQPAQVFWKEKFGLKGERSYGLTAPMTAAQLLPWGVNLVPWVSGIFDVSLVYNIPHGKKDSFLEIRADFLKSILNVPFLNWKKGAGQAALLTTQIEFNPKGKTYLKNLQFNGSGLKLAGNIIISQEKALESAQLSSFEAPETNASLSLTHDLHKGYALTIKGKSFNFSSFFEEQKGNNTHALFTPGAPIALSIALEKVFMGKEKNINHLYGELKGKQKADEIEWEAIELSGISGTWTPQRSKHPLSQPGEFLVYLKDNTLLVRANDAGAFLKNLGIYSDIKRGRLVLKAQQSHPHKPYEGWVKIKDFEVVEMPILTRLLSLPSPTGFIDFFSSGGISFDRFDAHFSALNSRIILHQAKGVSTGLGIAFKGTVDLKNQALFLTGNIIPAYMINSILSSIPLIGDLLLGGEGSGFLATRFMLKGPLKDPEINVNPLSSFAPGFLKKLFEDSEEEEKQLRDAEKEMQKHIPKQGIIPKLK